MTNFDQRNQNVATQYNAETIHFHPSISPEVIEDLRKTLHVKDKVINRLLQTLDENEVALEDRESKLRELAQKYKEIETRLTRRDETDLLAEKAKERLDEGDLEGAETFLLQSLQQNLKATIERKKAAAGDAFELANIKELQLDYPGALLFYEQAVDLAPTESDCLNRLGLLLYTLGDYDQAIDIHTKSLNINVKVLGTQHPQVATDYNNLGLAWHEKGYYDKAIDFYTRSLKITVKVLGEQNPLVATDYNNLGFAWHEKGDYDQAIDFHNKSLEVNVKALGKQHPLVATNYNNLGLAWHEKGDYDQAIDFHNKSLEINVKALGKQHPSVATNYNNLGLAWDEKGDYRQAIEFSSKALNIFENRLGKNHPKARTVRQNLEAFRRK